MLGGLVEGVWPPETRSDPWLSRPMRHAARPRPAGAAHLALRARLRAGARRAGGGAVARHQACRRADGCLALRAAARGGRGRRRWNEARKRGRKLPRTGRAHSIGRTRSAAAGDPRPKPPRATRPTSLSVTEIENWLRDPYTIYAKHILRLRAARSGRHAAGRARPRHRDPRRDRRVHAGRSRTRCRTMRSAELIAARGASISPRLRTIPRRARSGGRASCASRAGSPNLEAERRPAARRARAPRSRGELEIPLGERAFTLSRARRPHRASAPTAATRSSTTRPGSRRPRRRCASGLSPQLTLEGAILRAGGSRASRQGCRSPTSSTWRCAAATRPGDQADRVERQHARHRGRQGVAAPHPRRAREFEDEDDALPLARAADVHAPRRRRLRSPGAREGMVALGRRRRR